MLCPDRPRERTIASYLAQLQLHLRPLLPLLCSRRPALTHRRYTRSAPYHCSATFISRYPQAELICCTRSQDRSILQPTLATIPVSFSCPSYAHINTDDVGRIGTQAPQRAQRHPRPRMPERCAAPPPLRARAQARTRTHSPSVPITTGIALLQADDFETWLLSLEVLGESVYEVRVALASPERLSLFRTVLRASLRLLCRAPRRTLPGPIRASGRGVRAQVQVRLAVPDLVPGCPVRGERPIQGPRASRTPLLFFYMRCFASLRGLLI